MAHKFNFGTRDPLRILIVAEETLVRAALGALISSWQEMDITGEAATTTEVQSSATEQRPHVVLLSLAEAETLDIAMARNILRVCPRVVVLSDASADFKLQLAQNGIRYVVPKNGHPEQLRTAIHEACKEAGPDCLLAEAG